MNILELGKDNEIVITIDNAGSIGEKSNDTVSAPYQVLSYFTLRNAVMENLSNNTVIKGVTFSNFCGDKAYDKLLTGMKQVYDELGYEVQTISSTESNFMMQESAFSVTVIGEKIKIKAHTNYNNYAIVGLPLVGNEILKNTGEVVSIPEFLELLNHKDISRVITVGSKGINDRAFKVLNIELVSNDIDLSKSAGPSSCVLIEYRTLENLPSTILRKTRLLDIK